MFKEEGAHPHLTPEIHVWSKWSKMTGQLVRLHMSDVKLHWWACGLRKTEDAKVSKFVPTFSYDPIPHRAAGKVKLVLRKRDKNSVSQIRVPFRPGALQQQAFILPFPLRL